MLLNMLSCWIEELADGQLRAWAEDVRRCWQIDLLCDN